MIKKFDGMGQRQIKAMQIRKRKRLINNQCLAKKTLEGLEGMGFSLKKKLKKLKKAVKKVPGVKMASALAKGKIKEAIGEPMKLVNKVSAIPIVGTAARAAAAGATGGASELAIQGANIATGKQKLSLKSIAKQAAVSGASMATGGQSDTALKAISAAKAIKKVASSGKKLVKKVTPAGKTIVTEVPETYAPKYNESYVSSYSPDEEEFVETEVSEEGELVETKKTSPAAIAVAGGAAATLIGYLLLKGDN